MNKMYFFKNYFLPCTFFSLVINLLQLAPIYYMIQLYSRVITTRSVEALWLLSILMLAALVVMGALEMVRSKILVAANNSIDALIAPDLLRKMVESAVSPEQNPYHYALKDLQTVRTFLTGQGMIQVLEVLWLPMYMLIIYLMHPLMMIALVIGACLMGVISIVNKQMTSGSLAEANSASRNTSQLVDSAIHNAEVVNAMGMLPSVLRRWGMLNDRVIALQTGASNRAGIFSGLTKFMQALVGSVGAAIGSYIVLQDKLPAPGLMMIGGIMFGKALIPVMYITTNWKDIVEARSAFVRLDRFFKQIQDEAPFVMELPPPSGQISLEHVTFGIRSGNRIILKDISFSLEKGDTLGIVGPSASGKSSLARIMVGIWRPLQGVVRMDGADTANWPAERIGRYIGYLPQDIELFAGTIADNIARLDEPDPDQVIAAARLAGLHELILQMPAGYDTQIGEGGAILSGGQRQRIGFARALYGSPRLLVLDEPNASLDTAGEAALANALIKTRQAGITTILITHNPNYLSHVTKLLILQNGSVAAFGPKDWVLSQAQQARNQQAHIEK